MTLAPAINALNLRHQKDRDEINPSLFDLQADVELVVGIEELDQAILPAASEIGRNVHSVAVNGLWQGIGYLELRVRVVGDKAPLCRVGDATLLGFVVLDGADPPNVVNEWVTVTLADGWLILDRGGLEGAAIDSFRVCLQYRLTGGS